MGFSNRLHAAIKSKNTPALVGIDPRFDQLPTAIVESAQNRQSGSNTELRAAAFEEFSIRLIDVVAPLVPAVKPQAAFFEEPGPDGSRVLQRVIRYARDAGLIVICDVKRGDIGSSSEAYARGWLAGADPDAAPWGADAVTVNPYLGPDTLEPFCQVAREREGGIYVLVRTSNPGSAAFQDFHDKETEGVRLFERIADTVESLAVESADESGYGFSGAVVGATWPEELAALRKRMPHVPLLVPGYGSQGGTAEDVAGAFASDGTGAIVNSSRGINFAWQREPFAAEFGEDRWEDAVQAATRKMIADLAEVVNVSS